MEIKIEQKITVRIGETAIEMTPDEARKLRDALDRALGKQAAFPPGTFDLAKCYPQPAKPYRSPLEDYFEPYRRSWLDDKNTWGNIGTGVAPLTVGLVTTCGG